MSALHQFAEDVSKFPAELDDVSQILEELSPQMCVNTFKFNLHR